MTDPASLAAAMEGVDAAYYLVHSMGGGADFSARDREAAATFRDAAARAALERIVYLGGLGATTTPTCPATCAAATRSAGCSPADRCR